MISKSPKIESVAENIEAFWAMPLAQLEEKLRTDAHKGLSAAEASQRLAVVGPNTLDAHQRNRFLAGLFSRLRNPLILVLLAAAIISAGTGDMASATIIAVVIVIGTLLDAVQEARAHGAVEKLKQSVALRERVLRDGRETAVLASQIVPGDIVLLAAGDHVPADGRLLEAKDLFVNQALLTGEAYPAEKNASDQSSLESTDNALFMGSNVVSGTARMLIVNTGAASQLGGIATTLDKPSPMAALERGTYDFGILIVRVTGFLLLAVLLAHAAMHRPLLQSFMFALALVVGLTPELLPMVVSVTLARGAVRMAARKVIVKRLAAIYDLGSMDVLCTDKTGTLTESRISVERSVDATGRDTTRPVELAWLNSFFGIGIRTPLDDAILERSATTAEGWTKLDEVPFNFEKRRVSVLLKGPTSHLLIVKGAPEDVLGLCGIIEQSDGTTKPLDDEMRADAARIFSGLSVEGLRVLGIGWQEAKGTPENIRITGDETLVFAGFIAFLDPPKASAGAAIAALARNNIAVKIVTGDNELVTQHVCRALGIVIEGCVTGTELVHLSDEALLARVETSNLFCRVTPAQKNRIILALKRRGHVVGYLGDGINDAPSLHSADVGISVDSAVDVAKEAADMIMLERDLAVLDQGVVEGRRTFSNIMKYVMMATSSNFGNMFSMAGASIWLSFLPMLPIQILLNNLLYDFSEIAIPLDRVDPEEVSRPRHWDVRFVRNFMFVMGPVSSLFDVLTFALLIYVFHATQQVFQTGWFIESLATQILVIFVIRTRGNPLKSRPHPALVATSLGVLGLAVTLPYTIVGSWFGLQPLPWLLQAAIAGTAVAYLAVAQLAKILFYRLHRRHELRLENRAQLPI